MSDSREPFTQQTLKILRSLKCTLFLKECVKNMNMFFIHSPSLTFFVYFIEKNTKKKKLKCICNMFYFSICTYIYAYKQHSLNKYDPSSSIIFCIACKSHCFSQSVKGFASKHLFLIS